jgi:uncharacterized protein YbjT (DUF2867 family)
MDPIRTILIAGATGLVGSSVLRQALDDPRFGRVIVLARRDPALTHPKLEAWVAGDLLSGLRDARVDAVLCCLGTTIAKEGGDRARFIHVDKDLVVGLGKWAARHAVPVLAVVSSIGADAGARVFYSRIKGEVELELKALEFPVLHIFRPSVLVGPRKEFRVGERISAAIMGVLGPLIPDRYRPMQHDVLARAMLNAVFDPRSGTHAHRSIRAMAGRRSA